MPEEQQTEQPDQNQPESSEETLNTEHKPDMVPLHRLTEATAQKNEALAKLADYEKAEQKRADQEAIARGEHEKVIADLRPKAERAEALEAVLKGYLATELEAVPEAMRDLVPEGDVATQLQWVINAKQKGLFNPRQAPATDAGATGDKPKTKVQLTDLERRMARASNMTEEQYAEYKERAGGTVIQLTGGDQGTPD